MIRKVLGLARPLFDRCEYTIRGGLAKGMRRKGGLGFLPSLRGGSVEEKFLGSLDLMGKTIYDIGGYEGVFAMFFARAVQATGRVLVFEPNPINQQIIKENIALNSLVNTEVVPVAVGQKEGEVELVFDQGLLGVGSLHPEVKSNLKRRGNTRSVSVPVVSIDNGVRSGVYPPPEFIKIDVEGYELEVLRGMREVLSQYRPILFVELHDIYLDSKTFVAHEVVGLLCEMSYRMRHIELDKDLDRSDPSVPRFGHLYCCPQS